MQEKKIHCLAKKIVSNFSGLFGFIGVDILLDEGTWYIVEVNSRIYKFINWFGKSLWKRNNKKNNKFLFE